MTDRTRNKGGRPRTASVVARPSVEATDYWLSNGGTLANAAARYGVAPSSVQDAATRIKRKKGWYM